MVMTLDETTTNLDNANKRGLVVTLAKIIPLRAAMDNFQLPYRYDEGWVIHSQMLSND